MRVVNRFVWLLCGCVVASCAHGIQYSLFDIGSLFDPNVTSSYARDINSTGEVVGDVSYHDCGFVYSGGVASLLTAKYGVLGNASSINDSGLVAGNAQTLEAGNNGHIYDHGKLIDLGTLGGSYSSAVGINNLGQVVGGAATAEGRRHAYLYSAGEMIDLGTLPCPDNPSSIFGPDAYATGINDAGQIVGSSRTVVGDRFYYHAFMYSAGQMSDIGTLGGTSSMAYDINAAGHVVGNSALADGTNHGFLYSNGLMQDLGTLGGSISACRGINNLGQVVGQSDVLGSELRHGFLYSDGKMLDLNDLVDSSGDGWLILDAAAINDSGQIAASAYNAEYGWTRAVLLTPQAVPEPLTAVALSLGLVGILARRRRRLH